MSERCELCEPAPHPNCDSYTQVSIEDPASQDEGGVWVCMEHYDAIKEAIGA